MPKAMLRALQRGLVWCSLLLAAAPAPAAAEYGTDDAQAFLNQYCLACHQGEKPLAGFGADRLGSIESFREHPDDWTRLVARVANSEMPPKDSPAPDLDAREEFLEWVEATWREQACAADVKPAPTMIRRLNRDEYAATLRDLLDLQLDVSGSLPVDGPGGEGFDNAAETLFLSPLHSEKYLDAAKFVLDAASKEFKSRSLIFIARPGDGVTEREAATKILANFLPRAFRRPVEPDVVENYVEMFELARRQNQDFEPAIFFALRSALVSPMFLFHVEADENDPVMQQYALASRLSYFLWGSMPNELLFDAAAAGKMDDEHALRHLVPVLMRDPRSLEFATRFTEQWLRTRELEGDKAPDQALLDEYKDSSDFRADILLQPVFFFRHIMRENESLLTFLDSDRTILTRYLAELMELEFEEKLSKNPEWIELPSGAGRGGLLSMPAVLAVSSHPYRTSPVLRGAWILDSILGAPPPPPPPDVPPLEENKEGEEPKSVREMLTQHRANPVCASCHNRIDPLGFALENYDQIGRWRNEDAGAPIDASTELADGTAVDGPQDLKQVMLEKRELFLRNLTKRLMGYALGRGLTPADACAVETIVDRVKERDYEAWALLEEVVLSRPFRYPGAAAPLQPAATENLAEVKP